MQRNFVDIDIILKCMWKSKRIRTAKTILEKKKRNKMKLEDLYYLISRLIENLQ